MNDKSEIKAEDILSGENFSEELLDDMGKHSNVTQDEIQIAKKIYTLLSSYGSLHIITTLAKGQIKERLISSVKKINNRKRLRLKWMAAAAILLILVSISGIYYFSHTENVFDQMSQTFDQAQTEGATRLILGDGNEVKIDKKESMIQYSPKGENIVIDSIKEVSQKMPKKTVFNTIVVPYGKRAHIILSEGTKVWLNSGSKLIYPAFFEEDSRNVYLEGEGIFDVVHSVSKPFFVRTRDIEIKVLGTIFNVSVYPDDEYTRAILAHGKIEVTTKKSLFLSGEKSVLMPGDMVVFNREENHLTQYQVNPADYMSWRDGYFIFKSEKLDNILKRLGRYYNVNMIIQDPALKEETFSGSLDLKRSPEEVLGMIVKTMPFRIKYENNNILINSK